MAVSASKADRPPLPPGFALRIDRRTRVLREGEVLLGGVPGRLLRLTPKGANELMRWRAGCTPSTLADRTLARRLVDARLAHPQPPAGSVPLQDITVVVPVRNREAQLARCLDALRAPGARLLVVDDGSDDPRALERIVHARG